MGKEKAGALTPKAISNRIKAKGLQKLRWYCQMCQKQCRDENGFKCHCMSESHQRQLLLFADNPNKFIDTFSQEFEDDFMLLLRRRFGTRRVHANVVYQEYISERNHLHMNATQWETLTEFVKWLGREGKCKVDNTEKGWFIAYIDRDPETLARQKAAENKEKMEMDDDEKTAKFIEKQIEKELARRGDQAESCATELERSDEAEKVTFSLASTKALKSSGEKEKLKPSTSKNIISNPSPLVDMGKAVEKDSKKKDKETQKRKSALDEIMKEEEAKRAKKETSRKENWLMKGIVVKVVHKKLGEKYYKKKAVVKEVKELFTGIVKMIDTGDVLKIDQTYLETVIPAIGRLVLILNGRYRGQKGTLLNLDEKTFSVSVEINEGEYRGRTVDKLPYEDISKLDT
ncbi:DNA/RNA-binding protein KIN17-like [Dendronephthya gigantea]|uniref:DNA/RNA-binding protein KIN17-like n=1 Tax=Dendronephthya gigantea TaxID=151771 RepID=UPI00106CCAEF|nr:DNA/RNA-binding protein KIN17-like [Dendronephthya gigantea]